MIIGREKEIKQLRDLLDTDESQFVAVYGRRRVGKTYLVRSVFEDMFTFQHSGIYEATLKEQLREFQNSLQKAGAAKTKKVPKNWNEAFHSLEEFISALKNDDKKIIFIDELPWMDTPRSGFIRALDHFWNSYASARKDIILVICGSATSWIINNVIMNYGGLHNRLTAQIFLQPFCLRECKDYCLRKKLLFTDRQILEIYMALGGIPYYWNFLRKGLSVAQNFDMLFFSPSGLLLREFDALYASLFRNPRKHISIISALAKKKIGLSREEILKATHLQDSGEFSNTMKELEQCGFIRKYTAIGKKSKNAIYQLIDNYTLFYFEFMENASPDDNSNYWSMGVDSSRHNSWEGRAFERVCIQHLPQIKAALGFSAIISRAHSWVYKPSKENTESNQRGVQIDLLIDRNDDTINLCEIKYSQTPYVLDKEENFLIHTRKETFAKETKTKKAILLTVISPYGLARNEYANDVPCEVTLNDLFR